MNYERKDNVVTITDDSGKKITMTWDECKRLLKLLWKNEIDAGKEELME